MIRPIYTLTFALCAFITGLAFGYLGKAVQVESAATLTKSTAPTPTLAPRQDPKVAYYIGVYDACKLFAIQAAGMSEQEAQLECLGFVSRVKDASWYETSGK